ncbi:hypothetical protein DPMN_153553 [Dreissena polymorpha]|uniref:Uncharacterized protein n=1 Tax=Dreissena polymorpha TaxID=45954 RepID=A0A9D4FIU2_DREPO|nr:hypothetical protein DPMN_153553 [Dreissena polymorpha]
MEEVMKAFNLSRAIAQPYFNIYDKDGDRSIPHSFLLNYVHLLDRNGQLLENVLAVILSVRVCVAIAPYI